MRPLPLLLLCAACATGDTDPRADSDGAPPDADGDGSPDAEDCAPDDAAVFPGAAELPRDGIDNDCDATTCAAAGFSGTPSPLALPAAYGDDGATPFDQATSFASCADATPAHGLFDVSNDGRPDLVVTFLCGDDEATGDTRWLVHGRGDGGFNESPLDWTLPDDYGAEGAAPFANPTAAMVCGDGIPGHFLRDLDADGYLDLVVGELCGDPTIGSSMWTVHRGAAGGFETTGSAWALPSGYGGEGYAPFTAASASANCLKGIPAYTLADVDGDTLPDLVVTQGCTDAALGNARWDAHLNTGAGFGPATALALPSAYQTDGRTPFRATSAGASCGESVPGHDVADVDSDGVPDLVVTEACDGDTTVGDTMWRVHRGGAAGFADEATPWALPGEYGAAGTTPFSSTADVVDGADDTPGHVVTDLDQDGWADLLVTERVADATLGEGRWAVHFGAEGGFAADAWDWALPAGPGGAPWGATRDAADCSSGRPGWATVDLDGDTIVELLVTSDCADLALGDTRWDVYAPTCVP